MAVRHAATRSLAPDGATSTRRVRGLDAEQRRNQRRQQLLDAALELFAANGYGNTSIEQICQAAYVGTKSFYELFDGKETCYLELLRSLTTGLIRDMEDARLAAPDDEPGATGLLVHTFAHALVDDERVARVTFGHASGISPAIERERRSNRRWAAEFVLAFWQRHDGPDGHPTHSPPDGHPTHSPPVVDVDQYRMALGLVGGLFDLVADWLLDGDPASPADTDQLIAQLAMFADVVRHGLGAIGRTGDIEDGR